jgi:hypothetical protein
MASTSNRNTPGNYQLEQRAYNEGVQYNTYTGYGVPVVTYLPGDGLLGARIASENLSYNARDVESMLFGIGSTNLVDPRPEVSPRPKSNLSINLITRIPVILPAPLEVRTSQRPYPMD